MLHGWSGLLLAAIGGYWVLERAATHKGRLRQVGQLLGGALIAVSLVGVGCLVWCLATDRAGSCSLGKPGKGWYCPYSSKGSTGPATSQ